MLRRNVLWKLTNDFRYASSWNIPFRTFLALYITCHLSCEPCSLKFMQLVSTSCCLDKHRLWGVSPWTTSRSVYSIVFSWKHCKLSRFLHLECRNQMFWNTNCFINRKSYRCLAKSSFLMSDYSGNNKINTQKHKNKNEFPLGVNNRSGASSWNQHMAWMAGMQSMNLCKEKSKGSSPEALK